MDAPAASPAQFLALGDSYTIGEGVPEGLRWPSQLVLAMRARGVRIDVPHYIAQTGWTTDELSAGIDARELAGQLRDSYQLVSLQIGVNDQYRDRPLVQFSAQFEVLLSRAIRFAGGKPANVIVLSIPDWGVTPFARASGRDRDHIAVQIDEYNGVLAAACERRGVSWIDITDISRNPASAALLVDDGLHPSGEMYAAWARRVEESR